MSYCSCSVANLILKTIKYIFSTSFFIEYRKISYLKQAAEPGPGVAYEFGQLNKQEHQPND